MSPSTLETHGWTARPRDFSAFLGNSKDLPAPEPQTVDRMPLPTTPLARAVLEYAKKELREETFNHSMRVYYYGNPPPPSFPPSPSPIRTSKH